MRVGSKEEGGSHHPPPPPPPPPPPDPPPPEKPDEPDEDGGKALAMALDAAETVELMALPKLLLDHPPVVQRGR